MFLLLRINKRELDEYFAYPIPSRGRRHRERHGDRTPGGEALSRGAPRVDLGASGEVEGAGLAEATQSYPPPTPNGEKQDHYSTPL